MNEKLQMLEIVDENDKIIGLEPRDEVHKEGLLHREIHVFFITPKSEIVFQHRAKDKDTHPDKLDATVGGHVEPNTTYEETAIKECKEETGVDVNPAELVFLRKMRKRSIDKDTGLINNTIRSQYAYLYGQPIEDLQIEEGKSEGFEGWKIDDLPNLSDIDKDKFVSIVFHEDTFALFKKAEELLLK